MLVAGWLMETCANQHFLLNLTNCQRSPELGEMAQRDNLPIIVLSMDVDSDASVTSTIAGVLAQAGQQLLLSVT